MQIKLYRSFLEISHYTIRVTKAGIRKTWVCRFGPFLNLALCIVSKGMCLCKAFNKKLSMLYNETVNFRTKHYSRKCVFACDHCRKEYSTRIKHESHLVWHLKENVMKCMSVSFCQSQQEATKMLYGKFGYENWT